MKHIWIKKDNTKSLIVFFCGWGMDKNVIEHLGSQSDLVMFYDYRNLFQFKIDFYFYHNATSFQLGFFFPPFK